LEHAQPATFLYWTIFTRLMPNEGASIRAELEPIAADSTDRDQARKLEATLRRKLGVKDRGSKATLNRASARSIEGALLTAAYRPRDPLSHSPSLSDLSMRMPAGIPVRLLPRCYLGESNRSR